MKDIIKKWWFWFIIVFIAILIMLIFVLKKPIKKSGISKEEYKKIENGMTMTEVAEIINSENREDVLQEEISKIEDKSTGGTVYKYKYIGEKGGYAVITYEITTIDLWTDGRVKVILKEEFNLK